MNVVQQLDVEILQAKQAANNGKKLAGDRSRKEANNARGSGHMSKYQDILSRE